MFGEVSLMWEDTGPLWSLCTVSPHECAAMQSDASRSDSHFWMTRSFRRCSPPRWSARPKLLECVQHIVLHIYRQLLRTIRTSSYISPGGGFWQFTHRSFLFLALVASTRNFQLLFYLSKCFPKLEFSSMSIQAPPSFQWSKKKYIENINLWKG